MTTGDGVLLRKACLQSSLRLGSLILLIRLCKRIREHHDPAISHIQIVSI